MAQSQYIDTNNIEGEGDDRFDFEKWIQQNKFDTIKDVFLSQNMNTLHSLKIDNPRFGQLMAHPIMLQNSQLIPRVVDAIKSLQLQYNGQSDQSETYFLNQQESKIFEEIEEYKAEMIQLHHETKQMQQNISSEMIRKNKQITSIDNELKSNFQLLREKIDEKEKMLNSCIKQYQTDLHRKAQTINQTILNYQRTLNLELEYFTNKDVFCKDIIKKFSKNNKKQREKELVQNRNMLQQHYKNVTLSNRKQNRQISDNINNLKNSQCEFIFNNDNILNELMNFQIETKEPKKPNDTWICAACTFINDKDLSVFPCKMCGKNLSIENIEFKESENVQNIKFKFTICGKYGKIRKNGTICSTSGGLGGFLNLYAGTRNVPFTSNYSISNGIKQWTIKCNKLNWKGYSKKIGVVSNPQKASKGEEMYMYQLGSHAYYDGQKGTITINMLEKITNLPKWKPGDKITVQLDCVKWIIRFLVNGKFVGQAELEDKNKTYFPAINCYIKVDANDNSEFQLC
eukprot:503525_1